jgi:cobalamin biosynthesis protein CobT
MGSDDDRIYKRLEEGENQDTAVCLLWDCSGSMGSSDVPSNKAALARIAAVAFHEALLRAGIVHEVLGFNTAGKVPAELTKAVRDAAKRGEDMTRYSRLDETDNRMVFVEYGQADGRAITAITGGAANRDGECVLWAAKRLAARPERRKILIVGSDGQPSGARYGETERNYLRQVVDRVTAAGIEVVGIGIMDESVKNYYPTNVTIKTARDLPRVVMGQLTNLLLRKGTSNARRQAAV